MGWECRRPGREEEWEAVLRAMGGRVGGAVQETSVGRRAGRQGVHPHAKGRGGEGWEEVTK